jgi:hypothetical protein
MKINLLDTRLFNWKFIIGILISIIFSYYAFQNLEIKQLFHVISGINFIYIIYAVLLLLFSVYIRCLRWQLLFNECNPSIHHLFGYQLIGYFGNSILPIRAGELLRCIFVSRDYKISKSIVFGTVVLERFLDFVGMIALFLIFLFFGKMQFSDNILRFIGENINILIILLMLLLFILVFFHRYHLIYKGNNKILLILNNIIVGFKGLNLRNISPIIIYTIIIWSIYVIMVYFVQSSIQLNLSFVECIFILFISSLALSIPSSPSNIGTFESGVIYAMTVLGSSLYQIEFAIILHLITFLPYTFLGGLFFIYYNYQFLDKE